MMVKNVSCLSNFCEHLDQVLLFKITLKSTFVWVQIPGVRISIHVRMCENFGIWATRARLGIGIRVDMNQEYHNRASTRLRYQRLEISLTANLESGPLFAKVCSLSLGFSVLLCTFSLPLPIFHSPGFVLIYLDRQLVQQGSEIRPFKIQKLSKSGLLEGRISDGRDHQKKWWIKSTQFYI